MKGQSAQKQKHHLRIQLQDGALVEGWKSALPQLEGRDFVILSGVTRVLDPSHKEITATPNDAFIPISNIVQIEVLAGSESGPVMLQVDHEIDLTTELTNEPGRRRRRPGWISLAALALIAALSAGLYILLSGEREPAPNQSAAAPKTSAPRPAGSAQRDILFLSDRDGSSEIYIMPVTGGEARRLTSFGANSLRPDRSPTSGLIAFSTDRDGSRDLFIIEVDGTQARNLTVSGASEFGPGWSPDGKRLVFSSDAGGSFDIYTMTVDGSGAVHRLTDNGAQNSAPDWSPTGEQIAFVSDVDGDFEIYVVNADGSGKARKMTDNVIDDHAPEWSPDGDYIAFDASEERDSELYLVNVSTGLTEPFTDNATDDRHPAWSEDGSLIFFERLVGGDTEIYAVDYPALDRTRRLTDNQANDSNPG